MSAKERTLGGIYFGCLIIGMSFSDWAGSCLSLSLSLSLFTVDISRDSVSCELSSVTDRHRTSGRAQTPGTRSNKTSLQT